jgi:hypothetical protein
MLPTASARTGSGQRLRRFCAPPIAALIVGRTGHGTPGPAPCGAFRHVECPTNQPHGARSWECRPSGGRSTHAAAWRSRKWSGAMHRRESVPGDPCRVNQPWRWMPRRMSCESPLTRGGSGRGRAKRHFRSAEPDAAGRIPMTEHWPVQQDRSERRGRGTRTGEGAVRLKPDSTYQRGVPARTYQRGLSIASGSTPAQAA